MKRFQVVAAVLAGVLFLAFVGIAVYRLLFPNVQVIDAPLSAALPFAAIVTPTPIPIECASESAAQFVSDLDALIGQWDDGVRLAESTSRIALSPVVNTMQTLRRQATDLEPPLCGLYLQELQTLFMDFHIDGMLAFMADEEESAVEEMLTSAYALRASFDEHLQKFRADALTAYKAAHEPEILVESFAPDESWYNVQMVKDGQTIFSLPEGWAHPFANEIGVVAITDATSAIAFNIVTNAPQDLMGDYAPPTIMAQMEVMMMLEGQGQTLRYVRFGDNVGYMVNTETSGVGANRLNGSLRAADGVIYYFNVTKEGAPLTDDERRVIDLVLASIRVAS